MNTYDKILKEGRSELKSLYEIFINDFPDYIFSIISKTDSIIIDLNIQWEKKLGYTVEESLGTSFYQYTHPEDYQRVDNAIEEIHKVELLEHEFRLKKKDGTYAWIKWIGFEKDEYYYAIGIPVDSKIDDFLSRVTHELKTPLNAIIGFTDLIQYDNSNLPGHINGYIDEIKSSSKYLLELVNEIITLTNVSTNDKLYEDVNFKNLIINIIKKYQNELQKKNIILSFNPSFFDNTIKTNKNNIIKIFNNLIDNAIKYNISNGEVKIYGYIDENHNIVINIKNTGKGIKQKYMRKLFIPFDRLDVTSEIPGTGLGLSLTKKIVELLDGSIKCVSEPNKETTFTVKIPLNNDHINKNIEDILYYGSHKEKIKIIYVEDNLQNMMLVEAIMKGIKKIDFIKAYDGINGLKMIHEQKPEIILLDYHLPDINADDIYKELTNTGYFKSNKNLTCCVISADNGHHKIDDMLKIGFDQYFLKPINIVKFKQFINKLVQEYSK